MRLAHALSALVVGVAALPLMAQSTPLTTVRIASGLSKPVDIQVPPGETSRLFVVEQNQSDIHIIENGVLLGTTFLDLTGMTQTGGNEQGLLGMAFHPDYANNGYFYVNYNQSNSTVIERYTVSANPNVADPSSDVLILSYSQPQSNHNGGGIAFGPDGMLWIATGDGGNFNDTGPGHAAGGNSQSGATLLGKMLRIDVDGGTPYAIPADNPFVGNPNVEDEIWAFGLRNPWRYSFDMDTGDLWIGDVGQDSFNAVGREEINFTSIEDIAGVANDTVDPFNYGWRCMEGVLCTGLSGCACPSPDLTGPFKQWNHSNARSITGGKVYRGDAIPDLDGTYFYADYSFSRIWSIIEDNGSVLPGSDMERTSELTPNIGSIGIPATFGQDAAGEIYIADHSNSNGEVFKIVPDAPYLGLGGGVVGVNGDPILYGTGDTAIGQPGSLHLRSAAGGAFSILFISLADNPTPFKGGLLHTIPILAQIPITLPATGEIDIPWADLGAVGPFSLYWQWGIDDAAAPFGVSLSNALQMDIP